MRFCVYSTQRGGMIISRTPLRASLVGGGTDLPWFSEVHGGEVLSLALRKYVYIVVRKGSDFSDHKVRVAYSATELVDNIADLKHPVVREALRFLNVDTSLEIISMADVPSGTGLGSSSSFTVGLLHALHAYRGEGVSWQQLAHEACHIEIGVLNEPIGQQDQYIAAVGGFRHLCFLPDGSVTISSLQCQPCVARGLVESLLGFYVGGRRRSGPILSQLTNDIAFSTSKLLILKALCQEFVSALESAEEMGEHLLTRLGKILNASWETKASMHESITNATIERMYSEAICAGALGGKVLGAGGAGFLLLLVPRSHQSTVREAMAPFSELTIDVDTRGTEIVRVQA